MSARAGLLAALLAACASPANRPDPEAEAAPDEMALALPTVVRAETARLFLSDRWRKQSKLEAIRVERPEPGVAVARGGVVFRLKGLRVEARELRVKWMADYEDVLLYAQRVESFEQKRGERPYSTRDVSALTMANDQVRFFQQ